MRRSLLAGKPGARRRGFRGIALGAFAVALGLYLAAPATASTPDYPTGLSLVALDGAIRTAWDEPDDGGSAITRYVVWYGQTATPTTNPIHHWISYNHNSTTRTYTIPNLTNGKRYGVRVQAVNANGGGGLSTTIHVNLATTKPTTPTGLTATAGNASVALAWSHSDTSGSAITKWEYRKAEKPAGQSNFGAYGSWADICETETTSNCPGKRAHTVSGLTNGTAYKFKVRAVNAKGDSDADESGEATPSTTPAAPSGLTATAGNGLVTLSWTAGSNGGSAITGYEYRQHSSGAWGDWTAVPNSGASTTSYTVPSLDNGTAYKFEVRAVNATGDGAESDESSEVTPLAPTLAASDVKHDSATLTIGNYSGSWHYKHTTPTGGSCSSTAVTTTSTTASSLSGNTSYTFAAYSNSNCSTLLATASAFLTEPAKPSTPTVASGAGSGKLTLTSSVAGGSGALTKWQYTKDNGANWTDIAVTSATLSYTVGNLNDSTSYTFKVRAENATGPGPESDASTPVAPADETLTVSKIGTTGATLTIGNHSGGWYYKYTSPGGGGCSSTAVATASTTVSGLTANKDYTFKAYNDSGCSTELATADAFPTLTPKPAKPTVAVNNGEFTLSSSVTGGDASIVRWQYVKKVGNGAFDTEWKNISSTSKDLSHTVSGLPAGSYQFKVRAVNASGEGPESEASDATSPQAAGSPRASGTVLDRARETVRRVLNRTLAAVGTRTLTSALGNIGTRLADDAPGMGLTLAGQPVPLGAGGLPGAADNRTAGMEELFRTSAFSVRLGAADDAGASPAGLLWSLWGRGDFGSFEGRPESGASYSGEMRTAWLGLDGRAGPWVSGVAVSHGESETEYRSNAGAGRLETQLTAVYPYGRWTLSDGLELRGVLGVGSGETRHTPQGGAAETSALSMRMVSTGVRRALPAPEGLELAARADASVVRMEIGDGPEIVSGVSADSWRFRAGLEASRLFALEGVAALEPFAEAAGRRDGGDGVTGMGLEVAGGVRYTAPDLQVEARGRWLAAHSEEGARERGVSLTARVGPGAQGRGLSLSLSPRWGARTGAAEALWGDDLPGRADAATAGGLDARIGYGFAPGPGNLLTPFAEMDLTGGEGRRLRLGTRFEAWHPDLALELSGERHESGGARPEHGMRLEFRLRF